MKLGEEPTELTGTKDAQHVCVVVAYSREEVEPGDWVKFVDSDYDVVEKSSKSDADGIIDPFLSKIRNGDSFLVLLNPGLSKNLRHTFELSGESNNDTWNECRNCTD